MKHSDALNDRLLSIRKSLWLVPFGKRLAISPLFLILAFFSIIGGYADLFFVAYLSAFLHELAHIAVSKWLHISVVRIEIMPFGICGKLSTGFIKNPYKEIAIAIAGPLFSGMLAAILYFILGYMPNMYHEIISYGIKINISLVLLNLVPALPLDGGRIMKGIISIGAGAVRASNLMVKISRVFIIGILGVAVFLLLSSDFNFSLILIGAFLLGNLTMEQRNISLISLKEILYHKTKLSTSEFCEVKRLAAHSSVPARVFLRKLGCHKYHIIDVVGDDGEIIKTVTESQLISSLLGRSIRLSMGDI